ncbi:MAG: hypothetical protein U0835_00215 [Isosphaeraceae bacterium]
MATYKMLKTQKGVRPGDVHPVTFEEGKTYEIDDGLAAQFQEQEAIEPSADEPAEPSAIDAPVTGENWLDTDPAVLRHGELTAQEVVAKDESPNPQTTAVELPQVEGKAEGDIDAQAETADGVPADGDDQADDDGKPAKSKKTKA